MLLPGIRDEILNWASLHEDKFIDVLASKQTALSLNCWDEKANALVQDWSYGTPGKGDHTNSFLWFHCPHFLLQQSVEKVLLDQGKGIMLLPFQKNHSWFRQMGEAALDWWDLDLSIPLYCDNSGIIYKQFTKWTTRLVLFHALGLKDSKSQGKRWEDEIWLVGERQNRDLTCAQARGQCEGCLQANLQVTSDGKTTALPPLRDGSSDVEGSNAVLPHRGRNYRHFAGKGMGELLRGVQNVKAARLSVLHPDSPDFFQLQERSVRSAVESDMQDRICADYRTRLIERFKNFLDFKRTSWRSILRQEASLMTL